MSLQPKPRYEAPEETARVARAALPQGTLCTRIYDALGTIFQDADFVSIFPPQGQPAEAPVRLALATILQFAEGLSDRAAADAVRTRIDWKYPIRVSIILCSANSALACSNPERSNSSSIPCSRSCAKKDCSRPAAGNE